MIAGALMVAQAVVTVLVTAEPLPVPIALIGVAFLGAGSRQRRRATRRQGQPATPARQASLDRNACSGDYGGPFLDQRFEVLVAVVVSVEDLCVVWGEFCHVVPDGDNTVTVGLVVISGSHGACMVSWRGT